MKIKKLLLFALVATLTVPSFQSCKKGENDPFLSLKSRKARLKGDWELTSLNQTEVSGSTITTYTFNGSLLTVTSGSTYTSYTYSEKITFETDGTFTQEMTQSISGAMYSYTGKGNWWFGRRNKEAEYKNKETVVLQFTSENTVSSSGSSTTTSVATYTGSECDTEVWLIDELKSKEMVIINDGTYTSSGSIFTITGTSTYEKK